MTREEAINMVQGARQYLTAGNPIWDAKKIDEAMSMAIEALSDRTGEWICEVNRMDDLISRQAAIDYCYQLINVEHEQGSDEMNYGQERVNQTD